MLVDAEELAVHVLDPRHDLEPVVDARRAEEAGAVDAEVDAEVGAAVLGGEADEAAEALTVLGLVGGRTLLVEVVPQLDDLLQQLLATRRGGGRPRCSDGAKPVTVAPQSIVKPRKGEPTFS